MGFLGHQKSCLPFRCKIIKNLAPIHNDFMVQLIADTFPIFFSGLSLVQRSAEKGVVAYSQDQLIADNCMVFSSTPGLARPQQQWPTCNKSMGQTPC